MLFVFLTSTSSPAEDEEIIGWCETLLGPPKSSKGDGRWLRINCGRRTYWGKAGTTCRSRFYFVDERTAALFKLFHSHVIASEYRFEDESI